MSTPPQTLASLAEKQRRTAKALLLAYRVWSLEDAMSLDNIFLHRTPDCVQYTLPKTAGVPARNNEQYKTYLQELVLMDLVPWKGTIEIEGPIISDPDAGAAVAIVHGTVKMKDGTPGGDIHDRTVWWFSFTNDGEKVWKIEVWVDTRQAYNFREKFTEWRRKKGKKSCGKKGGHPLWEENSPGRKKSRSPRSPGSPRSRRSSSESTNG